MAKEYIEREAAKQELLTWARCINHPERLMTEDAIYVLDTLPAADVAPVVHGRWVFVCEHGNRLDYECTNCRGHIQIIKEPDYIMAYKRCPNCGARMDGGKENAAD